MTKDGLRGIVFGIVLTALAADAAVAQTTASATSVPDVPYLLPPSAVPLDEKQRNDVLTLRRELHDRLCTLSGELLQAQEEVRAQMARRPRSTEALREAARRVSEIRARMRAAIAEAEDEALRLLTPAQRTTLAKWREGRRRAGGEAGEIPYTVIPGIQSDEPDIENLEDPQRQPRY